jgi:hypothetical protein
VTIFHQEIRGVIAVAIISRENWPLLAMVTAKWWRNPWKERNVDGRRVGQIL